MLADIATFSNFEFRFGFALSVCHLFFRGISSKAKHPLLRLTITKSLNKTKLKVFTKYYTSL